jgi:hypothetical protein
VRRAALLLAALALTGCETTAEKSAKLEREAKRSGASAGQGSAQVPSITRPSAYVKVLGAALVHGSEGAAAAVTLRNDSPRTFAAVPIAITLKDAHGHTVFQNNAAGSEAALVSVPSIGAHSELTWVDDQLPAKSEAASVGASVGEGTAVSGTAPAVSVSGVHTSEEASGAGATGTLANHSATAQLHLVVFVIARRGASVLAAGRAVLPELRAGASQTFHAFFIGNPQGAQLQASAPAGTLR